MSQEYARANTSRSCGFVAAAMLLTLACSDDDASKKKADAGVEDTGTEDAGQPQLPTEERIYKWIEDVTGFGVRLPDSAGGIMAAEYVRDRFQEFGLTDVAIEETPTIVWSATRSGLKVNGADVPSQYMQHTFHDRKPTKFSTGDEGVTGELVYVGDGKEADFAGLDVTGKIVVSNVRFQKLGLSFAKLLGAELYDPEMTFGDDFELIDPYSRVTFPQNYYNAMNGGAAGFIGILVDYIDSNAYHNEAYEAYKTQFPDKAMRIPGLWVSPSVGQQLIQQLSDATEPVMATLTLEGELKEATGRNVIGYLRGQTDEIIVVESHHDSTTTGAVEDASGTAEVLALAEYFAQLPQSARRRTLLFATMDTHFTDYASHKAFVTRHIEKENILATITVEHIALDVEQTETGIQLTGQVAPRVLFVSREIEGLADITSRAVQENNLARTILTPTEPFGLLGGLPADSSHFFTAGVPVVALVGSPIYLYDSIDTLDKVAKAELPKVAKTFIEIIQDMDELPSEAYVKLPKLE